MKIWKNLGFVALGVFLTLTVCFRALRVYARLTGTNPAGASADIVCWGPKGSEVCIDSSGNLIPTTTGASSLGSSALQFKNLQLAGAATVGTTLALWEYTSAGVQGLAGTPGMMIFNTTLNLPCISTGSAKQGFALLYPAGGTGAVLNQSCQ